MSVEVLQLNDAIEDEYERFLLSVENTLLYTSIRFRNFLQAVLKDVRPIYLVALEYGKIVGALPCFVKYNSVYGNVLNSLPFFGSNGGIIVSPATDHGPAVKLALLDAFEKLSMRESVVASTVITNPLDLDGACYESYGRYTLRDLRVGQVTRLSQCDGNDEGLRNALMKIFHQKTRNSIRKAQKSGIRVLHSDSIQALELLSELHHENFEAIGGTFKPWPIFAAVRDNFIYDRDYRVYIAERNRDAIAALLVFFFNRTAEYFTPATMQSERTYQPMSLLIFEAMQDAARRGCVFWNWGGTWDTQVGVYRFKSRFGAEKLTYHYYVREFEPRLRNLRRETILAEYQYFYVLPFTALNS